MNQGPQASTSGYNLHQKVLIHFPAQNGTKMYGHLVFDKSWESHSSSPSLATYLDALTIHHILSQCYYQFYQEMDQSQVALYGDNFHHCSRHHLCFIKPIHQWSIISFNDMISLKHKES